MFVDTSNPGWFHASRAVDIIPTPPEGPEGDIFLKYTGLMKITQGPHSGKRFASVILPWQERIIRWLPHVAEIAIKCGKGSGKSVLVAGIGLGVAMAYSAAGTHHRGHIVIVAPTIDSGRIVFNHIAEAIYADSHLKKVWRPNLQTRALIHRTSGIIIQILPPTMKRAVGLRPFLLIVDELHEASLKSEFNDSIRQLRHGGMNWPDFKTVIISTAPVSYGAGYYVDWLRKARAIRDGKVIDSSFLPALFEFPVLQRPELEVDNDRYWFFGMPSLITEPGGLGTMDATAMRHELEQAEIEADISGAGSFQSILSQRLGIEAEERAGGGLTLLADGWELAGLDALPARPERVVVGVDPSEGAVDPFGLVALYIYGELQVAVSHQWLTEAARDSAPNHLKQLYSEAHKAGELSYCADDKTIEAEVFKHCLKLSAGPYSVAFGGDAAGLAGFANRFTTRVGHYEPVPQGWQLMASFNRATGSVLGGRLKHLSQPLLTYNVRNLRVVGGRLYKADADASKGGFRKIDGAMAMLSGIHLIENVPALDVESWIG